jgi:aminopeptidase N
MKVKRLFDAFAPSGYNLNLKINKDKLLFSGSVIIQGLAKQKNISVHAKNLNIKKITINGRPTNYEELQDDELKLKTNLTIGEEIEINIAFSGKITKPMHGIYPSFNKDGSTIISTQFESHHAREAFPCIDEPEAKATFDLSLECDSGNAVLGNMPVKEQLKTKNSLKTTFETSPVMSSYLLAFVVGDLQKISGETKNGTVVSIWSSKDHPKSNLKFALESAIKSTEFFNDYFYTDYPLPKCDHVALPDFSSGAMENWGLITYREVCLLVDNKQTSTATKEYVALVIAHEISHQWFGNLVTMRWWDDLWLNESFATLMEYLAVDHSYPEWDIPLTFAAHEALGAFRRDSLSGVQPVKSEVNHPDEISTLFDPSIVYAKGARLLLMAFYIVGEKNFRKGLKNYFQKYAYKNAEGDNLWDELSNASNIDLTTIMNSWIKTPGFPVLEVNSVKNSKKITLSQKKYSLDNSKSREIWPIPLFDTNRSDKIFNQKTEDFKDFDSETLFNQRGGHYIVKYTNPHTKELIKDNIKHNKLTETEKLFYLNNLNLEARNGLASIVDFMDVADAYKDETAEPVWSVLSVGLADAKRIIEGDELAEKKEKVFVYNLISEQLKRLGWTKKQDEPSGDTKLRDLIISLAVYSDNPQIIAKIKTMYQAKGINQPAELRGSILAGTVKHSGKKIFKDLYNLYPNQTNSDLKNDISGALCSTTQPELADMLLKSLKDGDWVKLQDVDKFIVHLLANKYTRDTAWKWLTKNWSWIEKNFASDMSYDHYPRYAASCFGNQQWYDRYIEFFEPKQNIITLKRNIELGKKEIENKIRWSERDRASLVKWLKELSV